MSDLLQFIRFSELDNWSVKNYLTSHKVTSKYDLVNLFNLLSQVRNNEILTNEKQYKLSGIHSHGKGLFHREIKLGEAIKSKSLNKLKNNQFVYSRLGSHTGSFDVVNKEFEGYFVSNEMPTFEMKSNKINPCFIKLVFLLKKYWEAIENSLQGTAHKRLKEKQFLSLKIPLPPLETQQQLVKNYQDKLNLAKEQNQLAKQKEAEIETYLYQELGIELPKEEKTESNNILKFVRFKDLDVWSFEQLKFNSAFNSIFKISELGTICKFKNKKFDKNKYGNEFFNYVDIGSVDPFKNILEAKKMKVKNAPNRATQHINSEDLIIATTRPYLKKFAIVSKEFNNYVCSSGFSVISYAENIYNLHFIKAFLQSYYGIEQLKEKMTGGLYPAITKPSLKTIKIPLPPLKIQTKIANHIQAIKDEIKSLKQQAEQNQKDALNEFEKEVFNAT